MRAGLTGGIGSGKSEVARILGSLGAFIIDTDELAREAVAPGSDGIRAVARSWPQVVREGHLDRAALAEIVFADRNALSRLSAIIHPFVRRLAQEREQLAPPGRLLVHVVPLLFETGYGEICDASILVVAPDPQRIARVMQRNGLSEEQVRARMAMQIDPAEARSKADYVIENNGDLEALEETTRRLYEELALAARR